MNMRSGSRGQGFWISGLVCLLAGCLASSVEIKKTLDEAAKADLKIILADIPPMAKPTILPQPYYVIDEYEEFNGDTALVYQARAKLVFFYLNPMLDLCQIRKYRFKRSSHAWERYEVELKHIPQKYSDTTNSQVEER